ncbi:MAG: hypothetical protein JSR80_03215 [Verrucomicrobia bacterium]|nr:hypothetical protein [Verrucomicrobiota bacterium]
MVECSAALIYERRQRDKTRNRDHENVEQIEYHQQISRSFLLTCTAFASALYVPIQNHGDPSDGAKQLIALIQSYSI